jgi:thioredoxin-like negative regulator of GroEL
VFGGALLHFANWILWILPCHNNYRLSQLYKIEGVPTFIFFRHGSVVDIFSGADEQRIRNTVERLRTSSYEIVPYGTKVRVHGLVKAAQHNGRWSAGPPCAF